MFQLNASQKNDLWMAFAKKAEAGVSFIQGHLHVKIGNSWQNTKSWDIHHAESAFGRSTISLPVYETPLGAIGRCKDFAEAFDIVSNLRRDTPGVAPAVIAHELQQAGFVMTGTGDIERLLSARFLGTSTLSSLSALDKPGFYTLIHPKNHPRLRSGYDPRKDLATFTEHNGFVKVKSASVFVEAMLTMLEQEHRHYEKFQHQLHAFMVSNNLSVQLSNNHPIPEDAEVWLPEVTPCIKTAFEHFAAGRHDEAKRVILRDIQLIYRPIKIRHAHERNQLRVSNTAEQSTVIEKKSSMNLGTRDAALQRALAGAQVDRLHQFIMSSRSFNNEERNYFSQAKENAFTHSDELDIDAYQRLSEHFMEQISPWLQQKANHDFPLFERFFNNTFSDKDCPDWYRIQLNQLQPALNKEAIMNGTWWDAVRRLKLLCGSDILSLVQGSYEPAPLQAALKHIFPDHELIAEWLEASGFQSSYAEHMASPDEEISFQPSPLPAVLF